MGRACGSQIMTVVLSTAVIAGANGGLVAQAAYVKAFGMTVVICLAEVWVSFALHARWHSNRED